MSQTLQQFRDDAASKAVIFNMGFRAGYVEEINIRKITSTSKEVMILLLPKQHSFAIDNTRIAKIIFFYFIPYKSDDTRDDFEMSSVISEKMNTYLKSIFTTSQLYYCVNNGDPFIITDFGGGKSSDNMFCCSCSIDILFNC